MTGKRRRGRDPLPGARPPVPTRGAPPPPAGPTFVVAPRKSRRALRAERRRQQRRRIGAAGIAGIVVAAIAIGVGVGFGVHNATTGDSNSGRTQQTLLMSVVGADGVALENALLATHGPSDSAQAVEVLVPSRVITDVCGFGTLQFGAILKLPGGARVAQRAASDLLGGVTVDGTWVLTTTQLAQLVDSVGGVTVDVDTDVIQRGAGGARVLVVPKGSGQRLNGSRAVAFATYVAPGEDASGVLARFQSVLDGVLTQLPSSSTAAATTLSRLGRGAASTLGVQRLARILTSVAADVRANNALPTDLPTVKIDSGGSPSYRVDTQATTRLVSSNLGDSWPEAARHPRVRVFVQNGVGTPGLVDAACSRLTARGFAFAGSGNASQFGFTTSKVLVFDSTVAAAQVGNRVAAALRLPASDVEVSSQGQNVADVVVILGKDFKR